MILSCKKSQNTPVLSPTTNSIVDSCGYNKYINFKSKGTPIGVFSDCVTDIDGNVYKTVKIGDLIWMAENLKVNRFNDGSIIPQIKEEDHWSSTLFAAWCYYNNDSTFNDKYGKLYNWYSLNKADNGNKNVCPVGWHVSTFKETINLETVLGGQNIAGNSIREIDSSSWDSKNTGATNLSLYTGIPSGIHGYNGFYYLHEAAYWWTSTESDTDRGVVRVVGSDDSVYGTSAIMKSTGATVRCVKD